MNNRTSLTPKDIDWFCKKTIYIVLLVFLLFWTSCNVKPKENETVTESFEYKELFSWNENDKPTLFHFLNGFFYYVSQKDGEISIVKKDTEEKPEDVLLTFQDGEMPLDFAVFPEGSIAVLILKQLENETFSLFLSNYDSEGNHVNSVTFAVKGEMINYAKVKTTNSGNIILLFGQEIYILSRDGEIKLQKDDFDFIITDAFDNKSGAVYFVESKGINYFFHKLLPDGTLERQYGTLSALYRMIESDQGIYAVKDLELYQIDEDGTPNEVLNLGGQGISGAMVQGVSKKNDDSYVFYVIEEDDQEVWKLITLKKSEKAKDSPVTEKRRISIAAINTYVFTNLIAQFNKSSETHEAVLKYYSSDVETRKTQIEASLLTANAPDLISGYGAISNEIYLNYVNKGIPAELSDIIHSEEYLSRVISDFTVDGKIYGLPTDFYVWELACTSDSLQGKTSWSIDEFLSFMGKNPNAYMEPDWTIEGGKQAIFEIAMQRGLYDFVDFENKKADFNQQEFKKLLQRIQDLRVSQVSETRAERSKEGEAVLWKFYMNNTKDFRHYEWISGEKRELTLIGFPDGRGQSGGMIGYGDILYVNNNSSEKEAAKEFYQKWLNTAKSSRLSHFPIGAAAFQEKLLEETEIVYLKDEDGNLELDENGDPIQDIPILNGIPYPPITNEQVEKVKTAIETAEYYQKGEWTLISIISEETRAFFYGEDDMDNIIQKLQGRVQLYLDELD